MRSKLEALGCQVVIIAQGLQESGVQWKKDHDLSFPLLIDRDMVFYRLFGLRRNVKAAWNLEIYRFYAARAVEGQYSDSEEVYDGDDMAVMGGDFIVKQNGEVIFARTQEGPFERPEIADLLQCLKSSK